MVKRKKKPKPDLITARFRPKNARLFSVLGYMFDDEDNGDIHIVIKSIKPADPSFLAETCPKSDDDEDP